MNVHPFYFLSNDNACYSFIQVLDYAKNWNCSYSPLTYSTIFSPTLLYLRPLQAPDGSFLYDIPPAQLLREMQPDAKFIITLNDPVRRMYSDYYFLHDNLKPLRVNMMHNKSADEFHERAVRQVNEFNSCIRVYMDLLKPQLQTLTADKGANKGSNSGGTNNSTSQFHMPHLTPLPGDEMFPIWFRSAQM